MGSTGARPSRTFRARPGTRSRYRGGFGSSGQPSGFNDMPWEEKAGHLSRIGFNGEDVLHHAQGDRGGSSAHGSGVAVQQEGDGAHFRHVFLDQQLILLLL